MSFSSEVELEVVLTREHSESVNKVQIVNQTLKICVDLNILPFLVQC